MRALLDVLVSSVIGAAIILALVGLFMPVAVHAGECGRASWYGAESGNRTANGERFDGSGMTAAHRSYAFGTRLRVRDVETGITVSVRVNDRGPYVRGRMLDLSRAAAGKLGTIRRGVVKVCVERVR